VRAGQCSLVRPSAARAASCRQRREPSAERGFAAHEPKAVSGVRATVLVRPKEGILDPQGQAVEQSLRKLGFAVADARIGRVVDVEVEASSADEARACVDEMCRQLLANPLIESYEVEVHE
jgi:phosphoribosylformylglycinamidine synthase